MSDLQGIAEEINEEINLATKAKDCFECTY